MLPHGDAMPNVMMGENPSHIVDIVWMNEQNPSVITPPQIGDTEATGGRCHICKVVAAHIYDCCLQVISVITR